MSGMTLAEIEEAIRQRRPTLGDLPALFSRMAELVDAERRQVGLPVEIDEGPPTADDLRPLPRTLDDLEVELDRVFEGDLAGSPTVSPRRRAALEVAASLLLGDGDDTGKRPVGSAPAVRRPGGSFA